MANKTIARIRINPFVTFSSLVSFVFCLSVRDPFLRHSKCDLLVLDNFEHLIPAAPLIITLNNLALATCRLGNFERAKQFFVESIETARGAGILVSLGHALHGLAEVHMSLKQYPEAVRLLRESISVRLQLGDLKGLANSFESFGLVLRALGMIFCWFSS